ncbi:MAG TPA: PAS domain S-box protein, partial [Thermomicrobiales bacterium]|nr:PAS domain S-box protein [Thermomicrobiales bacterium]
ISTEFINLSPEETDDGIRSALASIGEFAGVDRSYVFQFSPDLATMGNTHEWCADGVTRQAHRLHNAPLSALPAFTEQILRGEVVYVRSTDALEASAAVEVAELRYQEIKSLVLVPMVSRDLTIGFLGFDSVREERYWSDEIIRLLTFVGQIFVNALERRRAAEELREREIQYRRIFEATSDGLVISDIDTGTVLEANPALCRMHGYEYDEFIGLHRSVFVNPESYPYLQDYVQTIREGGEYRIRAKDIRKDGSILHVEVHGAPVVFRGKPAILGVVRDVTSDVKAYELLEKRVAQRTQELSALLEISHNVASTLELSSLLELILDQLTLVIDHTGASILALDGDTLAVIGHRDRVTGGPPFRTHYQLGGVSELWEGISQSEGIVISNLQGDSLEAAAFRGLVGEDVVRSDGFPRSCLWTPLVFKDQVIGLLSLTSREEDAFTRRDLTIAGAIARQAAIAIDNARLFEQAQGKAALEERQKLARELHDSVSQALYGIALGAKTARTLLDRDPAQAVAPVDYVLSLAEAGLAEMRALIFELRPESLATEGLVAALTKQTAALAARYRIEITMDVCDEPDVPLDVKETLYRIAQEAMHNTVKHAKADHIHVRLARSESDIALEVTDDGIGFDPNGAFPGHLGLQSMRERTGRVGGSVEIESEPGEGARVRTVIPVSMPADTAAAVGLE